MDKAEKYVGVWIRTSTDLDSQKESPKHHLERAKAYCSFKNWKIVEIYDLSAVSGKDVWNLDQTKSMLADVQSGRISGLIFSKLARLARSTRQLLDFSEFFQEHNADLISLDEAIDTSSPAGRLFFTVLAALAEFEREEIAERVRKSVPIRAKLGKQTGGAAPMGYAWINNALVVNEEEAVVVKKLFETFLDTKRKKTTARILNEGGYRTRRGSKFSDSTVDRLLRNPTMKGQHLANYTYKREGKTHGIKPKDEWVYTEVEAIVSEKDWEEANTFLKDQRKSRKKIARKPAKHMFTGFVFCGNCDKKMYVLSGSPSYTCKSCRLKIHKDTLESVFESQFKEFLLSKSEIKQYLLDANQSLNEKKKQLEHLLNQQKEVSSQMDKLHDLFMSDSIGKAGFKRKHDPLESRLIEIKSQIPELEGIVKAFEQKILDQEHIASESAWLYSKWKSLLPDDKHKVLELLCEKIIVTDKEVDLHLHYLPFSNTEK